MARLCRASLAGYCAGLEAISLKAGFRKDIPEIFAKDFIEST